MNIENSISVGHWGKTNVEGKIHVTQLNVRDKAKELSTHTEGHNRRTKTGTQKVRTKLLGTSNKNYFPFNICM